MRCTVSSIALQCFSDCVWNIGIVAMYLGGGGKLGESSESCFPVSLSRCTDGGGVGQETEEYFATPSSPLRREQTVESDMGTGTALGQGRKRND